MANELSMDVSGLPVTIQFISANLGTGAATVDMTLPQGGAGWVVPAGYVFHPLLLVVNETGTLDADVTVIAYVIDDGTELTNGPRVQIDQADSETYGVGVARVGAAPIAAGSLVAVSLTKDADYDTTNTIDWDATLTGVLLPA